MLAIVFEDASVRTLYPITLPRPAYAIACGGYRLIDWLTQLPVPLHALIRPHLHAIQKADFPQIQPHWPARGAGPELWINARVVPSRANFDVLSALVAAGQARGVWYDDTLAAALLTEPAGGMAAKPSCETLDDYFRQRGVDELPGHDAALTLFEYPHDVIRFNEQILVDNLQYRLRAGQYREVADGVFTADGHELGPYVTSDTSRGPILLDRGATIGPYVLLDGPAYIGHHTRVIEHAAIKHHVSIGHTAKIGGEVEAAVIEAYTNKQHHGFLGHSYLGSWINLGAGTCNSDLKNTYGEVSMEYGGRRVTTGMQFVGCIMGDYAKTAINTGIFTGKTIGVCSMLYGFVTTNVPSFVNYARLFGQMTQLPADVMIATQRRMFARRNVPQRPLDQQLIRDMHALTEAERDSILSSDSVTL